MAIGTSFCQVGASLLSKYKGGTMRRTGTLIATILLALFAFMLQGEAQLAIRAASAVPVPGWTRMTAPEGNRSIWVAPTTSLAGADIESAQSYKTADGRTAVGVVFTEAGARKMRDLSAAQLNKLIALIVDGKLIWVPSVRAEISKEAAITGNTPSGVPPEIVSRILASVGRK
jgi:preprotein translocase subunit SecD